MTPQAQSHIRASMSVRPSSGMIRFMAALRPVGHCDAINRANGHAARVPCAWRMAASLLCNPTGGMLSNPDLMVDTYPWRGRGVPVSSSSLAMTVSKAILVTLVGGALGIVRNVPINLNQAARRSFLTALRLGEGVT